MKTVLMFAAVSEAATGMALLIAPSFVAELLFGEPLAGAGASAARVAGIALIALGLACWRHSPLVGMLTYNVAVTLYLAYLAVAGELTGVLLWPVVALHAVFSILLSRAWLVAPER
ncbi:MULTISPECIES: hypothetical protein [Ensifer]|uniref:CPBP family intramembrane metalloprotease n=2 Tax=Ensifer TaxID=106591 RepID=A0AAW4FJC1_9HYPH|nr:MULTISPECIES: hypothetical protein [Ensifer]KQW59040.1 hypothetical protein ASD02_05715 [Ensifer sp. Root1252]KQW62546.1 hypothetical protein ASD03_13815 [Ensifer sp. Root127]KQY79154.1 hypothetical protein ASD52_01010 [Ensifer sp. Root142]KRC67875.1 hypothetical protein ASE32_09175 [Ensifer sp. Root231]KRC98952.1 hypothetical protein ASE47_04365 [Ensifer sp. Root258]MBD9488448.1 hypothetical protein [Ensifer sp. ENS11]PSS65617.1 hypothetical protein C6558_08375 [Ensifer sp. NM-2]